MVTCDGNKQSARGFWLIPRPRESHMERASWYFYRVPNTWSRQTGRCTELKQYWRLNFSLSFNGSQCLLSHTPKPVDAETMDDASPGRTPEQTMQNHILEHLEASALLKLPGSGDLDGVDSDAQQSSPGSDAEKKMKPTISPQPYSRTQLLTELRMRVCQTRMTMTIVGLLYSKKPSSHDSLSARCLWLAVKTLEWCE